MNRFEIQESIESAENDFDDEEEEKKHNEPNIEAIQNEVNDLIFKREVVGLDDLDLQRYQNFQRYLRDHGVEVSSQDNNLAASVSREDLNEGDVDLTALNPRGMFNLARNRDEEDSDEEVDSMENS